jgi:hypothetical protein
MSRNAVETVVRKNADRFIVACSGCLACITVARLLQAYGSSIGGHAWRRNLAAGILKNWRVETQARTFKRSSSHPEIA